MNPQPEAAVEAEPPGPNLAGDLTHLARILTALSRDLANGKRKRGTIGCVPSFPVCLHPCLTHTSRTDGPLAPYMKAARVYHIVVEPFGSPISVIYDGMANEFLERAREEGAPAQYVCAYMHIHLHICAFTCIYARFVLLTGCVVGLTQRRRPIEPSRKL